MRCGACGAEVVAEGEVPPGFLLLGYAHASAVRILRPDYTYPGRRVARSKYLDARVTRDLCDCPDEHVALYVARPRGVA